MKTFPKASNLEEAFLLRVKEPTYINDCWEWLGNDGDGRYGKLEIDYEVHSAHRLSWEISNGMKIPDGLEICHSCDNTKCVNPDHLWLGTHKENIQDAIDKGRMEKLFDHRGEAHPLSKLTDKSVLEIVEKYKTGEYSQRALGKMYSVSQNQIGEITRGEQWNSVTGVKNE